MFSFENDYSEGACPEVLQALNQTNYKQTTGYGLDPYCLKVQEVIRNITGAPNADVHFVVGGTQCNVLAITLLKSYEAVICVDTGHINVHETGAVEATGHKIITVPGQYGKITSKQIEQVVLKHTDEHMVKPKMVFISNATELGTIYTKEELTDISNTCRKYGLYLYMDGARLGNALVSKKNNLNLKDIASLVDVFYMGGTKNGVLLGEAFIIINDQLKPNFRYLIKQHCSMLAKARIIGVQFLALLQNNTYLKNASNANICAQTLKNIFTKFGILQYIDSDTNQIFPILDNRLLAAIKENYVVTEWGKFDDTHTIVRFVCSWATKKEDVEGFYNYIIPLFKTDAPVSQQQQQ